jgi:hypothetical protein
MITVPTPQALWAEYRTRCVGPEPLPKTQERECSLAFFGGMISGVGILMAISDGDAPESEQCQAIDEMLNQLKAAARFANVARRES